MRSTGISDCLANVLQYKMTHVAEVFDVVEAVLLLRLALPESDVRRSAEGDHPKAGRESDPPSCR